MSALRFRQVEGSVEARAAAEGVLVDGAEGGGKTDGAQTAFQEGLRADARESFGEIDRFKLWTEGKGLCGYRFQARRQMNRAQTVTAPAKRFSNLAYTVRNPQGLQVIADVEGSVSQTLQALRQSDPLQSHAEGKSSGSNSAYSLREENFR